MLNQSSVPWECTSHHSTADTLAARLTESAAQQPPLIGYYLQHLSISAWSSDTIVAYRPKKKCSQG